MAYPYLRMVDNVLMQWLVVNAFHLSGLLRVLIHCGL